MWPQDSGVLCAVWIHSFIGNCCLSSTAVKLQIKTDNYYLKIKTFEKNNGKY